MQAILFDLDGTLIDSAPDIRLATNKVLAEFDRGPLDLPQVIAMIGEGAQKLTERAFHATGGLPEGMTLDDATNHFLRAYRGHEAIASRPFAGVMETLQGLQGKGHPMAVCTNKPQAPAEAMLKQFDMDHFFSAVIGGDSMDGIRKPDARHLLAALDAVDGTTDKAVMIGDGDADLYAARNAGIPVIIVSFGYNKRPLSDMAPDAILDRYDDLETILTSFPC